MPVGSDVSGRKGKGGFVTKDKRYKRLSTNDKIIIYIVRDQNQKQNKSHA